LALELWNAMPDARVTATADDGSVLHAELSPLHIPTRKRVLVDLAAGDNRIAVTTPDGDDRSPWRLALMSDVQDGIDEVQDLFSAISAEPEVRFLLGAGDLSSTGSREELE